MLHLHVGLRRADQHSVTASSTGATPQLTQECSLACGQGLQGQWVKTQWRAEKLHVKEGEHFVEHKVLNL